MDALWFVVSGSLEVIQDEEVVAILGYISKILVSDSSGASIKPVNCAVFNIKLSTASTFAKMRMPSHGGESSFGLNVVSLQSRLQLPLVPVKIFKFKSLDCSKSRNCVTTSFFMRF